MVNIKLQRFLIRSKAPRTFEMLAHQYATSNLVKKKKGGGGKKSYSSSAHRGYSENPKEKEKKKNQPSSILCNRLNLLWLGKFHFLQERKCLYVHCCWNLLLKCEAETV